MVKQQSVCQDSSYSLQQVNFCYCQASGGHSAMGNRNNHSSEQTGAWKVHDIKTDIGHMVLGD